MSKKNVTQEINPESIAEDAGLIYVNDHKPGYTRKLINKHFKFFDLKGKEIKDPDEIERIRKLAIPPAYKNVWISPKKNGHLQATGRDARGRKQYRYHPDFKKTTEEAKYNKMIAFALALPKIRKQVSKDLALTGMSKEKILATIVNLLEKTLIRVGNEEYAKENHSFGLTTLRNKHVEVKGDKVFFNFLGKSAKRHLIKLNDKRLARIVKRCKDLPGQELFEYVGDDGQPVSINSTDVNDYLKEITGDHFTAKDFRTWAGTLLAVYELQNFLTFSSEKEAKSNIVAAIEQVAKKLGNTIAICRKCYIHPEILIAYQEGVLLKVVKTYAKNRHSLSREEKAVLAFLKKRFKKNSI